MFNLYEECMNMVVTKAFCLNKNIEIKRCLLKCIRKIYIGIEKLKRFKFNYHNCIRGFKILYPNIFTTKVKSVLLINNIKLN